MIASTRSKAKMSGINSSSVPVLRLPRSCANTTSPVTLNVVTVEIK